MALTIFIGIYFFSVFSFLEFQKSWSAFGERIRQHVKIENVREDKFVSLAFGRLIWILSWGAWPQTLENIFQSWSAQPKMKRSHWLMLALSPITVWPSFFFILGFLKINFYLLMGIAFVFWLVVRILTTGKMFFSDSSKSTFATFVEDVSKVLFFAGLLWLSVDLGLKNSMIFQQWSTENGLAFLLADGRLAGILPLLFMSLGIAFLVGQQILILPMALIFLPTQMVSTNGAVALFMGEALGIVLHFLLKLRLQKRVSSNVNYGFFYSHFKKWSLIIALGLLVGLILFGFEKESLTVLSQDFENDLDGKMFIVVTGLIMLWFPPLLLGSILGHFSYKK